MTMELTALLCNANIDGNHSRRQSSDDRYMFEKKNVQLSVTLEVIKNIFKFHKSFFDNFFGLTGI